jgi:urease accessory protein
VSPNAARLWQLVSPTLPVGAYSYSQALEYVVDAGYARDAASVQRWIAGLLETSLAVVDLAVLVRVHRAFAAGDTASVLRLSRELEAMRETAELRLEDTSMGSALAQLLKSFGLDVPDKRLPFASAFALACVHWAIAERDACAGYAWAWCEAQTAAAVKLVPLGHTAGQKILFDLGGRIPAAVDKALACGDDELGMSLPGFAIASALHETQYTRLFRS